MTLVEQKGLDPSLPFLSEATAGDYLALMKPRVMSLVVFTALVGYLAAPGPLDPLMLTISVLAIAVGAGASGALNMWYDADIDSVMARTARRPVPAGRVLPGQALAFGIVTASLSVMTLGVLVNWLAASMLAFTIFFYAVIYTMWLKRSTPQNIVIGGAAGAFPPMIGWAAAANGFSLESVLLFLIIFLWTPPHFWALALFKAEEYGRAGVPMMPNAQGLRSTRLQIFLYSLVLGPVGVLPWALGYAGPLYGFGSAVLGALFIFYGAAVLRMRDDDDAMRPAKALFAYSLIYLFAIFSFYLADLLIERGTAVAGTAL